MSGCVILQTGKLGRVDEKQYLISETNGETIKSLGSLVSYTLLKGLAEH